MSEFEDVVGIQVRRYRDAKGNPTCAVNFPAGKVCIFYMTQRFGCNETCFFANDAGKRREELKRRDGKGMLIPLRQCPVWNNVN
jgi:hypothetical protein